MRKFIGKFLAAGLCVAMVLSSVTVKADSVDQKYLALGADLTASQKKKVLELLDLDDNSDYKVITVTNKDEHEYLDSYLSSRVIEYLLLHIWNVSKCSDHSRDQECRCKSSWSI